MPRISSIPCKVPSSLGRPASHQNGDVLGLAHAGPSLRKHPRFESQALGLAASKMWFPRRLGGVLAFPRMRREGDHVMPMLLISHSRSTPELSFTRVRTVSPNVSMSDAVAL